MYFSAMCRLRWYCWAFLRYGSTTQCHTVGESGDFQSLYAQMYQ